MTDEENFFSLTASEEIKFVNHNPSDYESFRSFQEKMNARFEKLEKKKEQHSIVANIKKWEDSLPDRWKGAVLTKISTPAAKEVVAHIEGKGLSSFFLEGESGTGKTYLAYGIARRYIGLNYLSPAKIKIVSEETLMGLAAQGFEGRKRIEELLSPKYGLYIFDNVASKKEYKDWEKQLWEQLIDHIYSKDLAVIFTSTKKADDFAVRLSDSGDSKFRHLIAGSTIKVTGNGAPKLSSEEGSKDEKIKGLFS